MGPPVKPLSDLTESQKHKIKWNLLNKDASEGKFIDMLDKYEVPDPSETASIYTSYLLMGSFAYLLYKVVDKRINNL